MKVFITDLEAYNNGHLVGEWHTLPMEENLLAEAIENILQDGRTICEDTHYHEEYFITDYECEYMSIDEYANVTKLNEIAQLMESIDDTGIKAINFLVDNYLVKDIYEAIESYEDLVIIYEDCSMYDIAYDLVQESFDFEKIPANFTNYFDYNAFARDLELEGRYYEIDNSVYEYIG